MQKELTPGPLLNDDGELNEAGYATKLVKQYSRNAIKANGLRIKEWDYYFIHDDEYGIALTIADNSYMSLISASVLDFKSKKDWTKSYLGFFTNGSLGLPVSSETGSIIVKNKNYNFSFNNVDSRRHLKCFLKNLTEGNDFSCDIELEETSPNSMVIATPFKAHKKHFYYNQKINCLSAKGEFSFGPIKHVFDKSSLGVLDWGRGVWTYSNTWYWSSLSSKVKGHNIGFNLGYGFGDTSNASENILFVDDKVYKLNDVTFNIPSIDGKEDFLGTWTFTSSDGAIDLIFEPIIDRYSNSNIVVIQSLQHQVFGYFSGSFKVEGKDIKLDKVLGFAEKVKNRW